MKPLPLLLLASGCGGGPLGVLAISFALAPADEMGHDTGMAMGSMHGEGEVRVEDGMGMAEATGLEAEDGTLRLSLGFAEGERHGLGHDEEADWEWVDGGLMATAGGGGWTNMFMPGDIEPHALGALRAARVEGEDEHGMAEVLLEGEVEIATGEEEGGGGGHAH